MPYVPGAGNAWIVVPQASMPGASETGITAAAELLQLPPTGTVATNVITRAVGIAGVSVLPARSFFADSDTRPFGVTGQEQHDTICSSGVNAYTFAHKAPVVLADVPDARPAPPAPELEMFTTESPTLRLAT